MTSLIHCWMTKLDTAHFLIDIVTALEICPFIL